MLKVVDPAFGTLVKDLNDRNLLDETIVLWLGEFGRTPKINENEGRDHFPNGWSAVISGGGVRGGRAIGATNEDGTAVLERPVSVPDLFGLTLLRPGNRLQQPELLACGTTDSRREQRQYRKRTVRLMQF